jgi:hypothetical protein
VSRYAEQTTVSSEKSRAEIEATLARYGATAFMYGWDQAGAVIMFQTKGRRVKFVLPLPDRQAREFTHTPTRGTPRTAEQAAAAWEQASRQRWRALALVIKAKLEAVEAGITVFDDEFLAHMVTGDGRTIGEHLRPQLDQLYTGGLPALLPGSGS